jgi:hypothetical protein
MQDRAAHRALLAAAAAAAVALAGLTPGWAALVLALVAIYIATFTLNDGGMSRPSLGVGDHPHDYW